MTDTAGTTSHSMAESPARSAPMEVVALGLCRTGTQSLADGLTLLGYGTSYHMQEVIRENHQQFWVDKMKDMTASKATKMPTTAELEQHMGAYRTVCDIPPSLFVAALLDAYPDAKLVLTTRSCESWMKSVETSLLRVFGTVARTGNNSMGPMGDAMQELWGHDFQANGAAFFHEHHRKVRAEVAKRGREMLEFNVGDPDAWQNLCAFLGKESPAEVSKFPNRDFFRNLKAQFAAKDPAKGVEGDAEIVNNAREKLHEGEKVLPAPQEQSAA